MKKALTTIFLLLAGTALLQARDQRFSISGKIEGFSKGDTLRVEQIIMPGFKDGDSFDIVLKKDGEFRYRGTQAHDQLYLMTYHPAKGSGPVCSRSGLQLIVTDKDNIKLVGTRDGIYYCTIGGGIYDEPELARYLALSDSLEAARGRLLAEIDQANAEKDHERAREAAEKFNSFYKDNPAVKREQEMRQAYRENNPQGNPYLLIEYISSMDYSPLETLRETFGKFSRETRESYYGRIFKTRLDHLESIAIGKQAPDFTLILTDGKKVSKDDFKGQYLLIYNWGMCPGSLSIDGKVIELYRKYGGSGLSVIGLTDSLEDIREFNDSTKEGSSVPGAGINDLKAVLEGMLDHPWPEAELDTGFPENRQTHDTLGISGLPFFVLIGPDGTILARDFFEAFDRTCGILEENIR